VTCLAQTSIEEFRTVLDDKAGFTADDFSTLERGEMVIKLLPVIKREVAVCGVVRLQAPARVIAKAFQDNMTQQNGKSILATGKFSNPPTLADLETDAREPRH
jgi:hypothetical protein